MDHAKQLDETKKRLLKLRHEIVNLEQIMILLIGLNTRNKDELRQY